MVSARPKIPRTVWVLGLVSMFMDISSEIIHALLPVFMTVTLGLSVATVGLVDGIAEATASITKVFSGYLSDRSGLRKPLILLGYGLGAASKPLFAIATGALPVLGARFADRIGKGIRGAPRDALVADVSPPETRGRAFGLRQSLDTVGAFAGPLIAIGLMLLLAGDMRLVFWIAVIPGLIAVALVLVGVEDRQAPTGEARAPLRVADLRPLGRAFWVVALVGVLFSLARISEAFLVLRANGEGLPLAWTPLVLVAMYIVYALGAYPAGILSDRLPSRRLLLAGIAALVGSHLVLAFAGGLAGVFAGVVLWGIHMALTQGTLAKMVADSAPAPLMGSAFGLFGVLTGLALLVGSVAGGLLWDALGAQATFLAAAGFAGASALAVALTQARLSRTRI
ncbi:MFS transporter [Sphingomonas arenae]|uniref:MFS transporter n=1 Tax=Sphingomonas arenae TaxID=2812555 RepID=UPI0019682752|nr:MFS transporter [Sphingomonas arenae]